VPVAIHSAIRILAIAILVALTGAVASSAYAHGISHGGSGTRAAVDLQQQSPAAGYERAVTERHAESASGLSAPVQCPAGSGGGCCCIGRAALSDAAVSVIAASFALWFVVPRDVVRARAPEVAPLPLSTILVSAPPRAPPISI
jgi:hypothetical protein